MTDGSDLPAVPQSFARGEFDAFLTKEAGPVVRARDDDTPVLMGQTGPRRRATTQELVALIEELNRLQVRKVRQKAGRRRTQSWGAATESLAGALLSAAMVCLLAACSFDRTSASTPSDSSSNVLHVSGSTESAEEADATGLLTKFFAAYNGHELTLLTGLVIPSISWSDCNYRLGAVVDLHGLSSVTTYLNEQFKQGDRFAVQDVVYSSETVKGQSNSSVNPAGFVAGITYASRDNKDLRALGYSAGTFKPELGTKVRFTTDPLRIEAFANGPVGGSVTACQPPRRQ